MRAGNAAGAAPRSTGVNPTAVRVAMLSARCCRWGDSRRQRLPPCPPMLGIPWAVGSPMGNGRQCLRATGSILTRFDDGSRRCQRLHEHQHLQGHHRQPLLLLPLHWPLPRPALPLGLCRGGLGLHLQVGPGSPRQPQPVRWSVGLGADAVVDLILFRRDYADLGRRRLQRGGGGRCGRTEGSRSACSVAGRQGRLHLHCAGLDGLDQHCRALARGAFLQRQMALLIYHARGPTENAAPPKPRALHYAHSAYAWCYHKMVRAIVTEANGASGGGFGRATAEGCFAPLRLAPTFLGTQTAGAPSRSPEP